MPSLVIVRSRCGQVVESPVLPTLPIVCPCFTSVPTANAALVLHVVVHAHIAVAMCYLNRPAVTGDPAVRGYLAALNRLDRRTGRRGNVNGLVPTRGRCCAVACRERVARAANAPPSGIVPPSTGFANSPPAYWYLETVAEPNGFFFHLRFELCQRYAFCAWVSPSMDSTAALAFASAVRPCRPCLPP